MQAERSFRLLRWQALLDPYSVHNHFFLTAPPLRSELPGQSTFGGCHWRTGFWSVASSPVDSGVCAPSIPLTPGGAGGGGSCTPWHGLLEDSQGRMRAPGGRWAGGWWARGPREGRHVTCALVPRRADAAGELVRWLRR